MVMAATRHRRLCFVLLLLMLPLSSGDQIRLNSTYRCAGRVEILHNDEWGTVCDDDWDESDAEVVCRQTSCGSAVQAVGQAGLGEGSGQIWLDDVECFGNENSLSLCSHKPFGSHNCGHGEDAGVLCSEFLKQPPQMSVSPLKLTWGQNASVTCSLAGYSGGTFILKRFKQYLLISSSNPAIFILPQVTFDNKGPYHCVYQIDLLDEVFQSPKSDSVVLTVFPPTPRLCVSSPAEGQCTSDIGHVPRGGSFVLLCSVPSDIPEGLFTLSFPGSNSSISEPSVNHSASFHFPAEFQQKLQGLYSCVFQLTGASRTYTSQTASIHIFIQLPSMVPVALAVGGGVLLMALVSLLLFLVYQKRSQGHRSESTTRAQMNVAGNQDLEDSDDDQEDYVNVDAATYEGNKPDSNAPMRSNLYQEHGRVKAEREESKCQLNYVKDGETCSVKYNRNEDGDDDDECESESESEEQENIYANV